MSSSHPAQGTLGGPGQPREIAGWAPLAAPNPPPHNKPLERVRNQESPGSCKGQRSDRGFLPTPGNFLLPNPTSASVMNTPLEDPLPTLNYPPHSITLVDGGMGPHAAAFTLLCPPRAVYSNGVLVQHPFHPLAPFPSASIPPSYQPSAHGAKGCVPLCLPETKGPLWPGLRLTPHPAWRVFLELLVLGGWAGGPTQNPLLLGPQIPFMPTPGVTDSEAKSPPIWHFPFTTSRSPKITLPAGNDSNNKTANPFLQPPSLALSPEHHRDTHLTEGETENRQEKPLA